MGELTTTHFESFDGTRLAVHREGEGKPVILLHGLFSSAWMNWIKWGHATRLAEAGFEAIMLDFRVHGESEAPLSPEAYPRACSSATSRSWSSISGLRLKNMTWSAFRWVLARRCTRVRTGYYFPAGLSPAAWVFQGLPSGSAAPTSSRA